MIKIVTTIMVTTLLRWAFALLVYLPFGKINVVVLTTLSHNLGVKFTRSRRGVISSAVIAYVLVQMTVMPTKTWQILQYVCD